MNESSIDRVFMSMYNLLTDLRETDKFEGYFELDMMNVDTPMVCLIEKELQTQFGWDNETATEVASMMHRDILMHTNAYIISREKTSKSELYSFIYKRILEQRRGMLSTLKPPTISSTSSCPP